MNISIQGCKGSFHHIAATQHFSDVKEVKELDIQERETFKDIFEDVVSGSADYGVVAIENSIAGSLHDNYDLLLKYNVVIVGEVYLRIAHHLMAQPGTKLSEITKVLSHPMALKQCDRFLSEHADWKLQEHWDTACAATQVSTKSDGQAAIASALAAKLNNMEILQEHVETNKRNYTRFIIIARADQGYPPDANKSSIVFTAADKPGSLAAIMNRFAEAEINLSKIESRPIVGKEWSYYFYIDFDAGADEPRVKQVLKAIEPSTDWLKLLGSYHRGELVQ